jgi:hypothetical protein
VAGTSEEQTTTEESRVVELQPITSPQRQLVQLTLHYMLQLPARMKIVSESTLGNPAWYAADFVKAVPRALLFIDFPEGSAFIPMAAELSDGTIPLIYDEAARAFSGGKENPNPRPNEKELEGSALADAWTRYWRWFADNFDSWDAMKALEDLAAKGGRLRWVDYRVPIPNARKPLHLHVCGRGEHDTGVFAYNLVQRGYRHGLRMVATLKSGPDLNVLAIFDG